MHMRWIAPLLSLTLSAAACGSQPAVPTATSSATVAPGGTDARGGRAGTSGVVYVRTQALYYDTFATKDPLPMKGRFQLLENGETDYGPGDPQYLGGRWWEDLNGNGMQDDGDHFFLCPLLPPGRTTP